MVLTKSACGRKTVLGARRRRLAAVIFQLRAARNDIYGHIGLRPVATMLRVGGRPWRCECGANVLTKTHDGRYHCNGCDNVYVGE